MFGQSVPWPGGQSSGDSGETGGVPVSHTAAPRWVTTGLPTSNMKGAGGRGTGVQLEGPVGPGRGQAERRRYSGDRDSPLGRNTHCYGEGSCHLLWTRDCRPPGLARGANGAPEERPPPKAGPAFFREIESHAAVAVDLQQPLREYSEMLYVPGNLVGGAP